MDSFILITDELNKTYLSLDLKDNPYHVQAPLVDSDVKDICSFFDVSLPVSLRKTNSFSNDLTSRDDVLLAFGALLLLLLIEGIVTTFLLRTRNGIVSNFGFAVKQVVELIREFNIKRVVRARTTRTVNERDERKKKTLKLLLFAMSILVFVFMLEVIVLFLTQPEPRDVHNNILTFRIQQPVTPPWNAVRFHSRASINRPCSAVGLVGVDQGNTRINCCVTSTLRTDELDPFTKTSRDVDLEIISDLHEYGAEHSITLDGARANYSSRAHFTLDDQRSRLMGYREQSRFERDQIAIVHKQYVAYIASAYGIATKDQKTITKDTLSKLYFSFSSGEGPVVNVVKIRGVSHQVKTNRYTTSVRGVIPTGHAALRLGQHYFRGSSAVIVSEGNEKDLFIEEGMDSASSVVWRESTRALNWLTLLIILLGALVLLLLLRYKLKPVAIAEIAGAFVKEKVDADFYRSPVEMDAEEKAFFKVFEDDGEFQTVARVDDGVGDLWSGSLSMTF